MFFVYSCLFSRGTFTNIKLQTGYGLVILKPAGLTWVIS